MWLSRCTFAAFAVLTLGGCRADLVEAPRDALDSPERVVLELVPVTRIGFDSAKMWKASEGARPSDSPSGSH